MPGPTAYRSIGGVAAPEGLTGSPARGLRRSVERVVDDLASLGSSAGDSHDDRLRQGTLVLVSLFIVGLSSLWVLTYAVVGHPWSAAIPGAYQVLTLVGLVVLRRTRRYAVFRTTQLTAFLVLPALLQASLGGFVASSGMVLWGAFTPLAALALQGQRRSVPWLVAYLVELVVLAALDPRLAEQPAGLPAWLASAFFVLNVTGMTISAWGMMGYFVGQRERAHRALAAERERSERLLLNVLPATIAEQLKSRSGVVAQHHDAVSVLFADLVGFTERSAVMAPADLVALLDRIFTEFDRVADAQGVEKIKTIGDAYMVAGGLPEPRPDHLEAIARTALAMRAEITRVAAEEGHAWLAVRIGVDTGPAVAGVIGRRKFIYDLWGDTVNTASRMESHGLPGEVQLTARAARALGPEFRVRSRGVVDVKVKGPMETFLLEPGEPDSGLV